MVVKHIPLNESEHRMQRYREKQLEPPCEDEEIEEIEEAEDTEQLIETEKVVEESQENVEVEKETDDKEKPDGNESDHSGKSRSSRSRSRSRSHSKSRSVSGKIIYIFCMNKKQLFIIRYLSSCRLTITNTVTQWKWFSKW